MKRNRNNENNGFEEWVSKKKNNFENFFFNGFFSGFIGWLHGSQENQIRKSI